jgi:hypothetical protein
MMTPRVHATIMANEGLSVFGRNGLRAFSCFRADTLFLSAIVRYVKVQSCNASS